MRTTGIVLGLLALGAALPIGIVASTRATHVAGGGGQAGASEAAGAFAISASAPEQQAALADGIVSWDEHEAAIAATAECLTSRGVTVEVAPADGKRPSSIGFRVATVGEGEEARAKLDGCRDAHLTAIESVWLAQQADVARANAVAGNTYVADCLRSHGQAIGSLVPVTNEDISKWISSAEPGLHEATLACLLQRRVDLGY